MFFQYGSRLKQLSGSKLNLNILLSVFCIMLSLLLLSIKQLIYWFFNVTNLLSNIEQILLDARNIYSRLSKLALALEKVGL